MTISVHQKIHTKVAIAALYMTSPNCKQPKCLLRIEWINKSCYSYDETSYSHSTKQTTATHEVTDKSHKHFEQKKSDTEEYICIYSIYAKFKNKKNESVEVRTAVTLQVELTIGMFSCWGCGLQGWVNFVNIHWAIYFWFVCMSYFNKFSKKAQYANCGRTYLPLKESRVRLLQQVHISLLNLVVFFSPKNCLL